MFGIYLTTLLLIPWSLGSTLPPMQKNRPSQENNVNINSTWGSNQISAHGLPLDQEEELSDFITAHNLIRRADDTFGYPDGLSPARIIIDQSCTQDEATKEAVEDALKWIPTLIGKAQEQAKKLRQTFLDDETAALGKKLKGDELKEASKKGLLERMQSWENLFGTKNTGKRFLTSWVKVWDKMSNILSSSTEQGIVRITCHDTIFQEDSNSDECRLPLPAQAVTFGPSECRTGSIDYRQVHKDQSIVNLCADFFKRPHFSDFDDAYQEKVEAAKKPNSKKKAPKIPSFKDVNTGARILLHEFTHLRFTMNTQAYTPDGRPMDFIDGKNIKDLAGEDGLFISHKAADQNAYFAFWAYYAPEDGTTGCDMWPADDEFL